MRLANAFCRLVEVAGSHDERRRDPGHDAGVPRVEVLTLGLD